MSERRDSPPPLPPEMHLELLEPRVADAMRLILQIAGGDFTARGEISSRRDEIDAIVVGLNMLAESFERERLARDRAEALLADAIDSYENAPGLFCSLDATTLTIVKCNQTLADAVGLSKEALDGCSILELCDASDRADLERVLRALIAGDRSAAHVRVPEVQLLCFDGRTLTATLTGSVMRDEGGQPLRLRLSLRDVTAERRLETQLLHSQKMDAIGQLAGGVAHDFNNLLMVIQSATALIARKVAPDTSQMALLGQVQEATGRASALTRQLLTFARREVARPVTIDVGQMVRHNQAMLARLLGSSIALEVQVASGAQPVHIDPARFEQALMNLVINARDAMSGGGSLVIAIDRAPQREGAVIRVSVTDTGHGIAPEHKLRIFEPFFTTKPPGSGTGLGLAMAYGIVTQAGGEMRVTSELGKGARFELLLPEAPGEPASGDPSSRGAAPRGGSEKVLVVEDEPNVRALLARILKEAGYFVHEAKSGPEALALPRELLDGVALVISDVIMPGMPGTVLIEALRRDRPKLRCMLMSGYPADHKVDPRWFLQKPFDASALLGMVRERLDLAE
jgi:two-component system cell cycle sensor histidine kinase/response regulator CckA